MHGEGTSLSRVGPPSVFQWRHLRQNFLRVWVLGWAPIRFAVMATPEPSQFYFGHTYFCPILPHILKIGLQISVNISISKTRISHMKFNSSSQSELNPHSNRVNLFDLFFRSRKVTIMAALHCSAGQQVANQFLPPCF